MKLVAYSISGKSAKELYENREYIAQKLKSFPEQSEHKLLYCLENIRTEDCFIVGTINQEYLSQSALTRKPDKTFDLAKNVWDCTVFVLDFVNKYLYIEKKRYSGVNLNHGKTLGRLHDFISKATLEVLDGTITLIPMKMGVDRDFIIDQLKTGSVKSLKVIDLYERTIPDGTKLHNPDDTFDIVWTKSYNKNDSKEIDKITIEAKKDHTLKKSIIAKAVLFAGGKPKEATIYDDAEEKYVKVNEVTEAAVWVNVPSNQQIPAKISTAIEKLSDIVSTISSKFSLGVAPQNDKPRRRIIKKDNTEKK